MYKKASLFPHIFIIDSNFGLEYNKAKEETLTLRILHRTHNSSRGENRQMSVNVIAYDVGTTGLKACLFQVSAEESVQFLAGEVDAYDLHLLGGGAIEQDPAQWWEAMARTTRKLLENNNIPKEDIKAITFCSQMQNVLMVDEGGAPLRPAISWMDTRADLQFNRCMNTGLKVEGLNVLKVLKFLKITGAGSFGSKDPVWKYLWVRDNEPELFQRAYKWLDATGYLLCRATGVMRASRDIAGSTFLYDVKKDRWSPELCSMIGVEMRHLPVLCASTDQVGGLLEAAAAELGLSPGTPVVAGGSDVSLCQIGAGCVDVGDVNVYSGTSGWVETTVDRLHTDIGCLIGTLVGADPKVYNYVAEVDTSGKCMEWVKDRVDLPHMDYDQLVDYIRNTPAGSNGVVFSPWMHGNRCPFEDANARGCFFNLDISTRGSDLVKSVIEGVCLHMRWLLQATEKTFQTKPVVRFTGGSAVNPYICQVLADVLGREVETIENPRLVGAMGAAALAAVSLGMLADIQDIKHIIRVNATYAPSPKNTAVYDRIFPVFQNLYKDNKKSFAALNGLAAPPAQPQAPQPEATREEAGTYGT